MFNPDHFVDIINRSLPEPHASLLAGMIFGQNYSRMGAEFYHALVRTGTLHVVALSGTNVTILIKLIGKLTRFFGKGKAAAATLGTILGFVLFVGADPPIVRAAIMGGIAALAEFFGRRQYSFLSLLFAGGIMLLVRPEWLYALSFQLSFLATLGIIVFDSKMKNVVIMETGELRIIGKIYVKGKTTFVENLRTTLAAQIFITPLLVYNFGRLSLIAPLSNALGLWSVEFITPLGIFLAIGGALWRPLGMVVAWVAWVFLEYFILVVEWSSRIQFGEIIL